MKRSTLGSGGQRLWTWRPAQASFSTPLSRVAFLVIIIIIIFFFKDNQIICLRRFCHIGTSREQVYFFHKTPVSLQFPIAVLLSNEQEFRSNLLNALERQGKRHSRRISDSRTSKISSVVDHTAANPECWVLRVVYQ